MTGTTPSDGWSVDRRGKSGKRYRLRFHGQQLHWLSVYRQNESPHLFSRYWYWWRIWYRKVNGTQRVRRSIVEAFADLGYDAIPFINGRHVRMAIQPPPPPPPLPPARRPDLIDVSKL